MWSILNRQAPELTPDALLQDKHRASAIEDCR